MTNPYQPFFDKLDRTIADLAVCESHDAVTDTAIQDAVDLLRRSGYVLANTLNVQANTLPVLVLEPEPEVVPSEARGAESTGSPSVEPPSEDAVPKDLSASDVDAPEGSSYVAGDD